MIVLDTNVLSELMRPAPSVAVTKWVGEQPRSSLYTTAVNQAEILYGIALLPEGARRDELRRVVAEIFEQDLAGRVLPFDEAAAAGFAEIAARRRRIGRPIAQFDAQIAAIARAHRADIATRNTADFADCEVQLHDPWDLSGT